MSRSKHQTLKSVMDGQSKGDIATMFAERDHDAIEWIAKRAVKNETLRERRTAKSVCYDSED